MKFLIVDDSAVDRHLLTSLLEEMGHQVDTCPSPKQALDRLSSENYAAMFLDVVMPEQDGYKILREVRSNQKTAKAHVILYSSKKTPLEINYGLNRAGADNYLTKPVTRESVAQVLQTVNTQR